MMDQRDCQLDFITPEKMLNYERFRNTKIYQEHLVALIVDEAHCIKTWGDNFRISFSKIGGDMESFTSWCKTYCHNSYCDHRNVCSLTETCMKEPSLIALTPLRDNIMYTVKPRIESATLCPKILQRVTYPIRLFDLLVSRLTDCYDLYRTIQHKMGATWYTDDYRFRLVYPSISTTEKRAVLQITEHKAPLN